MSQSSGDLEERILTVEREYWNLDWRGTHTRLIALEQQLAQAWAYLGMPTGPPPPTPTNFSGSARGCNSSNPGSGQTVVLKETVGGTTLWTGTTNGSGNYSGTVSISAATSTAVTVTPTSPTQQTTTGGTETLTPGVSHTYGNINLQPATGYACSLMCGVPINKTLSAAAGAVCSGNTVPNDTLNWQSSPPAWATGLVSGAGWLGSAAISLAADPGNTYVYWLQNDGTLSALRQNPSPVARQLASPPLGFTCGTTFSAAYHCGVGGSAVNVTISG